MIKDILPLTLTDYPEEIACIFFSSGCNMRCHYCHNKSLLTNTNNTLDIKTIETFLHSRQNKLTGVVLSGGEITLNPHITELCMLIKHYGYKIKLDTNGTNPKLLSYLIENKLVDMISLDIKHAPLKIESITQTKNQTQSILKSIVLLSKQTFPIEFRTTLIKNIHTLTDIKQIIELLPENACYTLQNYHQSETVLNPEKCHPFTKEELNEFKRHLITYPIHLTIKY